MTWSCDDPDHEGAWSWGVARKWSDDDWNDDICPKLAEWSKLTWAEVDRFSSDTSHKMHHMTNVEDICDEAQRRLAEVDKEGEEIFRFRLSNKKRLWGFRIVSEFEILWFDPTHTIYPVDRK
jgi:hypothetical protein